jgi:hypothetical protein
MLFRPREGVEFHIPADWWAEARMKDFVPQSESYRFKASPQVSLVRLDDIACPSLEFRTRPDLIGGFNHDRMLKILRGIVSLAEIDPIKIVDNRHHVADGYHRFYASLAVGFSQIPTKLGWMPDTPALNAR